MIFTAVGVRYTHKTASTTVKTYVFFDIRQVFGASFTHEAPQSSTTGAIPRKQEI